MNRPSRLARPLQRRVEATVVAWVALTAAGCRSPTTARQPASPEAVVPVGGGQAGGADATGTQPDVTAQSDASTATAKDASAAAWGGLWVTDAKAKPVGVLVQRGHPSLSGNAGVDVLRDGAVVFLPSAGVFAGLQLSTGLVLHPRLGVDDSACSKPLVAGYYTDSDAISGPAYAFVYNGAWYRVQDYQPLALVSCAGTVADGVGGKCAPHNGTCRGFPVQPMATTLPLAFDGPLQIQWLAP